MSLRILRAVVLVSVLAVSIVAGAPDPALAETYEYDAAGRLSRVTYDSGRVVDYFYDGNSRVTSVVSTGQTGVGPDPEARVLTTALGPASPNPAFRATRIRFSLAEPGDVRLRFFDVSGRLVQVIEKPYAAGEYEVQVNVERWGAGVYFYRLEVEGFGETRRVVVVR